MLRVKVEHFEDGEKVAEVMHEGKFACGFVVEEDGSTSEGYSGGNATMSEFLMAMMKSTIDTTGRVAEDTGIDTRTGLIVLRELIDLELQKEEEK